MAWADQSAVASGASTATRVPSQIQVYSEINRSHAVKRSGVRRVPTHGSAGGLLGPFSWDQNEAPLCFGLGVWLPWVSQGQRASPRNRTLKKTQGSTPGACLGMLTRFVPPPLRPIWHIGPWAYQGETGPKSWNGHSACQTRTKRAQHRQAELGLWEGVRPRPGAGQSQH